MKGIIKHHTPSAGFSLTSHVIARDAETPPTAIRILIYLLSHEENFILSIKSIADRLKLGRTTVRNALHTLETRGYLYREQARTEGNRLSHNIFHTTQDPINNPIPKSPTFNGKSETKTADGKATHGKEGDEIPLSGFKPPKNTIKKNTKKEPSSSFVPHSEEEPSDSESKPNPAFRVTDRSFPDKDPPCPPPPDPFTPWVGMARSPESVARKECGKLVREFGMVLVDQVVRESIHNIRRAEHPYPYALRLLRKAQAIELAKKAKFTHGDPEVEALRAPTGFPHSEEQAERDVRQELQRRKENGGKWWI